MELLGCGAPGLWSYGAVELRGYGVSRAMELRGYGAPRLQGQFTAERLYTLLEFSHVFPG